MMGSLWANKLQLGRESTAGTAVAATTIPRWDGGNIKDDSPVNIIGERVGIAIPTNRSHIPFLLASLAMAATPATFEELPHILDAGVAVATPTQDGTGSDYIYTYNAPLTSVGTLKTYTIEGGDDQQAEEMEYSFVESFTLSGKAKEGLMMSANWLGRQVSTSTFTGALTIPTVEDILGQKGTLYIDPAGSMGSTVKTQTLLAFSLEVTTGWTAKFTMDSGQKYFDYAYFNKEAFQAVLKLTYEHNATGVSEKAARLAETARDIQLDFTGSTVGTPGTTYSNKTLSIQATGKYDEVSELNFQDGNSIVDLTLRVGYDPTAATGLTIIVVNELTALP